MNLCSFIFQMEPEEMSSHSSADCLLLSHTMSDPPPASCCKKGLTHDEWALGLWTNHMTEQMLSSNRGTATAGLCDVKERGGFFVQPSKPRVWQIASLHVSTHSISLLHADCKSGKMNPRFCPEGPNGFSHGPEKGFNQIQHQLGATWMEWCMWYI